MNRRLALLTFAVALTPAMAISAPRVADQKVFAGKPLQVVEVEPGKHLVLLDGRRLYTDDDDMSLSIEGTYQSEGHTFALIMENSGGSACPAQFRIIDLTSTAIVSSRFGSCSDTPKEVVASDGGLAVTLPQMDGQANQTFRYASGKVTAVVQPIKYNPIGPEVAPGGDLAAVVTGKYISDVVQINSAALAISRVMGERMFDASRKRIQGGPGIPFEARGSYLVAWACVPHLCDSYMTAWAFDHSGHAWASWTEEGRTTFFGNPTAEVKAALLDLASTSTRAASPSVMSKSEVKPTSANAKSSPAQPESRTAQYDHPLEIRHMKVQSDLVEPEGGLICYYYSNFVVKRIDSGSPGGDVSVSVIPTNHGQEAVACTPSRVANEITIKDDGKFFLGVKGVFIVLEAADPNGSVPFAVYDARTGKPRYSDALYTSDASDLIYIADESDTLHLRFRRGIDASCSLAQDGQACWAKIAREARLPMALARAPAPTASCRASYARQKVSLDGPSIVIYNVDLTVPPGGGAHVISRGEPSCEPHP